MPSNLSATAVDLALAVLRNVALAGIIYVLCLVTYRLFFHPLAKHPGPLLAKITDWQAAWHAYRGNRHTFYYKCHELYGPVVRVGPNILSFNTNTALKTIYGHSPVAKCVQKGPFYSAFPAVKGVYNTHNAISKADHGFKRRVLSVAFSEAALKSMEGLILDIVETFIAGIDAKAVGSTKTEKNANKTNEGIDMGEMFSWLTFDVMGELCFGKTFGMLTDHSQRFVTDLISKATHNHYISGNYLPLRTLNLGRILFPTIARDRWRFIEHSRACANERMAKPHSAKKDFFYYLLHARDPETGRGFSTKELWGEANVLMIAGSDTTATALSSTLFYLCRNRDKLEILKDEIRGKFDSMAEIVTGKQLGECHYLKASIDEAMRLAPPVSGLLPREVISKDGCVVDDVHVPKGVVIGTPIYSIHHNAAYYPDPFSFQPERWLHTHAKEEDIAKAQSAFSPFSIGARGCIGKSVAYMELRIAIARLVWGYEFWSKKTEGKAELWREGHAIQEGEFRLMDHFTCMKEGPVVTFEKRVFNTTPT